VIVFDDADIDSVVNGQLAGIFGASGQSCGAGSRLICQEGVYDRLVQKLTERARSIRIGDPTDPATDMGPLATERQVSRIERLIGQSLGADARLLTGGERPSGLSKGFYFSPTI